MHYTEVRLGSLRATLWVTGIALSLTCAFWGAAVLTNLRKKLVLKVTKHEKMYSLVTAKHNSIKKV